MKVKVKLILLVGLALLFSQSLLTLSGPSLQNEKVQILEEQLMLEELAIKAYRQDLQAAGEFLYHEESGQLELAYGQALKNEQRVLLEKAEEMMEEKGEELAKAILRNRLQLTLLDLNKEQQEQKLKEAALLQEDFETWQKQAEEKVLKELNRLEDQYEQALQLELTELKTSLEQAMEEDYALYKKQRAEKFRTEISGLDTGLRNALVNR